MINPFESDDVNWYCDKSIGIHSKQHCCWTLSFAKNVMMFRRVPEIFSNQKPLLAGFHDSWLLEEDLQSFSKHPADVRFNTLWGKCSLQTWTTVCDPRILPHIRPGEYRTLFTKSQHHDTNYSFRYSPTISALVDINYHGVFPRFLQLISRWYQVSSSNQL